MRDSIIVSVSDLRSLIQDVRRSGKEYVQLSILEPIFDEDGDSSPAELLLSAFDPKDPDVCIEYDGILAPDNESELACMLDGSIHMSANLI